jgi:hypothetical protein
LNPQLADGACVDTPNPDAWFHDTITPGQARRLCLGCPAQQPCLDYALHHPVVGVRGGTTPNQRSQLRRRAGITLPTGATTAGALCRHGHDLTEPGAVYLIPHSDRATPERRCVQCDRNRK